jgi:hypothetical protein
MLNPGGIVVGRNNECKRFAGAVILFFVWVALLTALAVSSSYRPANRANQPVLPTAGASPRS